MSGYSQTSAELWYSYGAAATVSTPTVAPGSAITGGYPACEIPGKFFSTGGTPSRAAKLKMAGLMTATATIPTWQFFLYFGTTNAFATTTILASTGTFTPTAGTNVPWDLEADIVLRTLALGSGSTIGCIGKISCPSFPSPFFQFLGVANAGAAYSPLATYAEDANAYLWPALSLGAATAGNTVTVEYMKLYLEN